MERSKNKDLVVGRRQATPFKVKRLMPRLGLLWRSLGGLGVQDFGFWAQVCYGFLIVWAFRFQAGCPYR